MLNSRIKINRWWCIVQLQITEYFLYSSTHFGELLNSPRRQVHHHRPVEELKSILECHCLKYVQKKGLCVCVCML